MSDGEAEDLSRHFVKLSVSRNEIPQLTVIRLIEIIKEKIRDPLPTESISIQLENGIAIEDDGALQYLITEASRKGELLTINLIVPDIQELQNHCRTLNQAIDVAVEELEIEHRQPREALDILDHKTRFSSRRDHPEWFQNVHVRFQSKEAYFNDKFNNRVKKYILGNKSQQGFVEKLMQSLGHLSTAEDVTNCLKAMVKEKEDERRYFDRTYEDRFCDQFGQFSCKPVTNRCNIHSINPYSCNDARILFGNWHLDHIIARNLGSGSIFNTLKYALENNLSTHRQINVPYFYKLLCTKTNMTVVHKDCHHPQRHGPKVDSSRVFLD